MGAVTGTRTSDRILVVEGYGHSREGLTASLRGEGLSVEAAAECAEAVQKMHRGEFGVAIIDVDLAASRGTELTGWDLARAFRALHPDAAIVLVTAEWAPEVGAEAERLRECCVVEKPIDPVQLRAIVRALQADAAARRAAPVARAERGPTED
jgi:CheY-like chemotaxis protein